MGFAVGDIVRHRIFGSEKVIIGIWKNRYLCASSEDIQADGHLRPRARVALHEGGNLHKIGHHGQVMMVDVDHLYEKELKQTKHFQRTAVFKKKVALYLLFIVTVTPICYALLAGVERVRSNIESTFFRMLLERELESVGEKKEEKSDQKKPGEEREEGKEKGTSKKAEKQLKKRYLKTDISEEDIQRLKKQYLKADISVQDIARLGRRYMEGWMTREEKEMLKSKYLKREISPEEKESLKRKYLR